MSLALKIENLSKMYRLGTVGTGTLSHDLNRWWALLRGKDDPTLKVGQLNDRTQKPATSEADSNPEPTYVWALKDINLEVEEGEILGIIGRNGAGKSTLLKLLSRVTAPTTGSIKAKGRIASLLEVGTGFHPELTGRENVYLNGAIMGMTKQEISRQLDEIVDFSGCDKYIDTPVKRYSSGMTVRLGFAVAAHLDCEILIVDEVLAVGDAEFQKRCIGKMGEIGRSGRTVLFVSHNLGMIEALCTKSICIQNGITSTKTSVQESLRRYTKEDSPTECSVVPDDRDSGYRLEIESPAHQVSCGATLVLCYQISCPHPIQNPTLGLVIYNSYGIPITGMSSRHQSVQATGRSTTWSIQCDLGKMPLTEGVYYVSLWFGNNKEDLARFTRCQKIELQPGMPFVSGATVPLSWGHIYWKPQWSITNVDP